MPRAVVAQPAIERGVEPRLQENYISGDWLRVFPETAEDVRYLQNLEHQCDKFAPASGHGVLVARRALPQYVGKKTKIKIA